MKSRRGELALAGVTVIRGATFVLVKSALADVSTPLFLALRFTLATVVLVASHCWRTRAFSDRGKLRVPR